MDDKDEINVSVEVTRREEEYLHWLEYAKLDYDAAVVLKTAPMHPRPLNIICYHCQQAAEKAAKALVVYYGSPGGMAKKHDVSFQLNQIKNILKNDKGIVIPEDIYFKAVNISVYASEPRYPNEMLVSEENVEMALYDSKAIMDWVKEVIAAPSLVGDG